MIESSDFRITKMPLNHGAGHMPVLGFGTLIPDAAATISATTDALEAGFRHFDCAERYRNEREVGEALQAGLAAGGIARENIFVTTKLWNTNHRPERVEPAFEASLERLRLNYLDLYLIHTPFAFQPGEELDPRDTRRQCPLRPRGDFARHLEGDGESCGPWQMPGHWTVRHHLERAFAHLRIGENQAGGGPGRSTSVSAANGASGILQGERYCVFGWRAFGSWNEAGAARRSSDFGNRCAGWKDASTGAAGMGGATRHGFAGHDEDGGPDKREFQHLRPSRRRIGRDQSHPDQTEAQ
jgi:hypothetical protein